MMLGPGVAMLNATLAGPVRLDLYGERRSTCEIGPRLAQPRVLLDRVGLEFRVDPAAARPPVRAQLGNLLERYGYGFMWPGPLRGRGDATTGLMNATFVVQEFLVPALLARERPEEMHRELLSSASFLSPVSRERIADLVDSLAAGYLARRSDGGASFTEAQVDLVETVLTELHVACDRHRVDWPDATEREIRAVLHATMER